MDQDFPDEEIGMDGCPTGSFLLIDEQEQIVVDNAEEFVSHLGCKLSTRLKVVSIFGNTGDGKSHTLNHAFFNGEEVFRTSSDQRSCTIGIWVAYSKDYDALVIDTEGLLGVSDNENRRIRLLLKILAISDIVLYRTRAERLHNDMFQFLDNASNAYWQYFAPELQAALRRNSINSATISSLGPIVVIFHETQFTQILGSQPSPKSTNRIINKDESADRQHDSNNSYHPSDDRVLFSAEEHIQMRFTDLKFSPKAFSCIEYVGTQTLAPPTDFTPLQKRLRDLLGNNSVRAPRTPDIVMTALQTLNETFSNDIESSRPAMFPDAYFSCQSVCKACGVKCDLNVNHVKRGVSHDASVKCRYLHDLDNKVLLCQKCNDHGLEQVVEPVAWSEKEAGWFGIAQYAWSGSVIECPRCGIIYRSRERWFGNIPPEHGSVKTENVHVWPTVAVNGVVDQDSCSSHTGRRLVDTITSLSDAVSSMTLSPSQQVAEWINNQVIPDYWIPDSEIQFCSVCERDFDKYLAKHHCRACGKGVCDSCSSHALPVPWRGWGQDPVRVCDSCYREMQRNNSSSCRETDSVKKETLTSKVTTRYISENLSSAVGWVGGALKYPSKVVTDVTRPAYWTPDHLILNCCVCELEFGNRFYKHHCRSCGQGVCEDCSLERRPLPSKGWDYPVRICDECIKTL